jgi:single-strand DNA-binding protein
MANLNKVIMIGRLTKDPELSNLPSGTAKCEMRIASNRTWKDRDGEKQNKVCYVDVLTWGRTAENCAQYLEKGREIMVEGRLDYSEWENKEGQHRSKHQVVADQVQFLGRDKADSTNSYGRSDQSESRDDRADKVRLGDSIADRMGVTESDLPF